jgi:hypothetical protein
MTRFHPEPNTAESYVNALLTTLAKIPPKPVTITPGPGVPSLLPLANDPEEQEWIRSLPFDYDALDGTKVLSLILILGGYHFWQLKPYLHVINAALAGSTGELESCRFHVDRRWRLAGPITITRVVLEPGQEIHKRRLDWTLR